MSQVSQTGWQIFVEVPGKAPIELPPGESVIGRSRACLVQIAETTVSRQHAIFVVEPGRVKLRDLGSSNGTFVNGQRVDGEMPLEDGDRVVVGEAELVLRMLAPLGPAEATAKLVIPPMLAKLETPAPTLFSAPMASSPAAQDFSPPPAPPRAPEMPGRGGTVAPSPAPRPEIAAAAKTSGEMLSSIRDIDLAPPPAPALRKAVLSDRHEPAGFWLRVVATLLDGIPFGLLAAIQVGVSLFVSPKLGGLLWLFMIAYWLLVFLVMPALKGTTPGKKLMKLAIVSDTTVPGQGLGWKTAALRLVGYLVCSITFGLGYLLVAFSARKQGLHDLIAKTNVVRRR